MVPPPTITTSKPQALPQARPKMPRPLLLLGHYAGLASCAFPAAGFPLAVGATQAVLNSLAERKEQGQERQKISIVRKHKGRKTEKD